MSKRRRAGAGRRIAEQRFWDGPTSPGSQGSGSQGSGSQGSAAPSEGAAEASEPAPANGSIGSNGANGANGADRLSGPLAPSGAAPVDRIRPTSDPAAVVRSLGPPPFAIDGSVAERHLTAVYEEAVRAATALAAANGLLAGDEDSGDG
jgi:hypothetical protein